MAAVRPATYHSAAAIGLVVLLVGVPVSAQQVCQVEKGELLVPWGPFVFSPPQFVDEPMDNADMVYYLGSFIPGNDFRLFPAAPPSTACVGASPCTPERIFVPDFNVEWYLANGQSAGGSKQLGEDQGTVPAAAAFGVVYMRYGPDVLADDDDVRAVFQYDQYC